MKNLIFSILLILSTFAVYAQGTTNPTPSVGALLNAKNVKLNEAKGRPNVNIPLFNISTKGINLPISLNYSTSGVKVPTPSSWVGNSWTLFSTGVINRSRNDFPDNAKRSARFFVSSPINSNPCISAFVYDQIGWFDRAEELQENAENLASLENFDQSLPKNHTRRDDEPDIFEYVLPTGKTGSFMFADQNTIICSTNDKIEVELDNNRKMVSYTIIDEKGNQFYFADTEQRQLYDNHLKYSYPYCPELTFAYESTVAGYAQEGTREVADEYYNVGWYLTKITTTYGAEINYNYSEVDHSYKSQTDKFVESGYYPSTTSGASGANYKAKVLNEISWGSGKIDFITENSVREDVKSGSELKALSEIRVFNNNNELVRKINFDLYYNLAKNGSSVSSYSLYKYKRLWLRGITIDNNAEYEFDYFFNHPLPHKESFDKDVWDYSRGPSGSEKIPTHYYYPNDPYTYSKTTQLSVFPRFNYTGTELLQNSFASVGHTNRLPVAEYGKSGLLRQIIYPGGGAYEFDYEPNTFYHNERTIQGNGFRVTEIKTKKSSSYSSSLNVFNTITYNYTDPATGKTSGRITTIPVFGKKYTNNYEFQSLSEGSKHDVNYTVVTRFDDGEGKVEKHYTYPEGSDNEYALYSNQLSNYLINKSLKLYSGAFDKDYSQNNNLLIGDFTNQPVMEKQYDDDNNLLNETLYEYQLKKNLNRIRTFKYDSINGKYSLTNYYLGGVNLQRINDKKYESGTNNFTQKETFYEYNSLNHASKITEISNGENVETLIKYPLEHADSLVTIYPNQSVSYNEYATMLKMNMLKYPIEKIRKIDGKVIEAEANMFTLENINGQLYPLPEFKYTLSINSPISDYDMGSTSWDLPLAVDSRMEKLKIIDRYDGQGNIVQHRQSDKHEPITLIWGYNKQYLIAKIENASVSKIANALGISSNSVESLNEHDLNDIDNLRDILKGSLITTYRYKPLVGIISKTNSSNKKTFYQYDSQNRLEFVKDHTGNIIKEYNYHYKTN
ncbi:MAG: hypothetical protein R3353_00200 [Salegentibacter mishustinae]|nr:hypothetical protein [Salegentibacter mishustinae]